MAQNNHIVEQNNLEYAKLIERMYAQQISENVGTYSQQQTGFGSYVQHNNTILQQNNLNGLQATQSSSCVIVESQGQSASSSTLLVSNQVYQEYTSTNGLPPSHAMICTTTSPQFKANVDYNTVESQSNLQVRDTENDTSKLGTSIKSGVIDTPKSNGTVLVRDFDASSSSVSTNSVGPPKETPEKTRFRVAEFVIKNLDSVPGEERFYNNLSKSLQQKFYAQKINYNGLNSSNSYSTHSTSVVIIDRNSQIINPLDGLPKVMESTEKSSDNENLPTNKRTREGQNVKDVGWIAERDHILKEYSHKLMRKKPRFRTPRRHDTDDCLSSDNE